MAQQDYTAIRVTEAVKDQAQDAKQEGETWDEYVLRCTEHPPEVREFVESTDTDEIVNGLKSELDFLTKEEAERIAERERKEIRKLAERSETQTIKSSVETIEQRTGSIERTLEGMGR